MTHFCSHSGATLSLTALRLLVPPLRLVSAAVWQTIQQKAIADYGMLEEFVSMVTDILPELLTSRQRTELSLGLRARVSLSASANEVIVDLMDLYFFAFVFHVDKSFARLLFSYSLATSFTRTAAFPTVGCFSITLCSDMSVGSRSFDWVAITPPPTSFLLGTTH